MKYIFLITAFIITQNAAADRLSQKTKDIAGHSLDYMMSTSQLELVGGAGCQDFVKGYPREEQVLEEILNRLPKHESTRFGRYVKSSDYRNGNKLTNFNGHKEILEKLMAKGLNKKEACTRIVNLFGKKFEEAKINWFKMAEKYGF